MTTWHLVSLVATTVIVTTCLLAAAGAFMLRNWTAFEVSIAHALVVYLLHRVNFPRGEK